ncbi:hypothetical protein SNE40_000877 [Patella caerulea]|uniref:Uncharacterized protein n=1 Tax=Patella caerulea TaxID=87958 RepID=A0AAN8Q7J4_PATCE
MWFVVYFLSFFVPYVFGCGETINAQTGQIQSANYPRNYPDNQDCTWAVTVSGASIKVTFKDQFGIEQAGGCGYDYVQLYSITSRGAASIGKYCGGQSPGIKLVPSNRMMVKFKSDGSVNEKGFSVNFTAVVNGGWGGWSNFENVGQCSTTCGTGSQRQTRTRQCDNPAPLGGGSQCSGSSSEDQTVACKLRECPVHGGWSTWSDYEPGQCSVSCGTGYQNETSSRDCNNPTPVNSGEDCQGDDVRTRQTNCSMDPCPIHGGWSTWSDYEQGQCSASCGTGYQNETSSRDCNNPTPSNGGEDCQGDDVRTRETPCSMDPCPVDGGWGEWSDWEEEGDCSVTCGEGMIAETHSRTCDSPEPMYGGQMCNGHSQEGRSVPCNRSACQGICEVDGDKIPYARDFTKYYECTDKQPVLKSCPYRQRWQQSDLACANICPYFGSEMLAHPNDCYKFVQCVWSFYIEIQCPSGTAWSTTAGVCVDVADAQCRY